MGAAACGAWARHRSAGRTIMYGRAMRLFHRKIGVRCTYVQSYLAAIALQHLAAVSIADGERCHQSPDNQTIVAFSQCPFGCCQCDRCHPDKPGYDGQIWSRCGSERWCSASARGFWWIILTAVGSVLGLIVCCVIIDWCGWRRTDQTSHRDGTKPAALP